MKETAFHFCLLCDQWILLGPHKQVTDPVTSSGCFLVTENTPRGQIAHVLLSGRRLASKKHHNPPLDLQPEPEVILVQPKSPEPEIIALPVSQEAADILSESPMPEPRWTPDEREFYEVEILRHNTAGSTGKLSNENRVFVHNHVARNTDYPPGSTLWVRLKPAGVDALYDWRAVEIWKQETPELEPVGSATLADIFKENL